VKKSSTIIRILSVLLPLTALCSAGVASFLWHSAHERITPCVAPVSPAVENRAEPGEFSAAFEELLRAAAAGFGIPERDIKRRRADSGISGVQNTFTVNAPSSLSLTLFHLILSDSVAAHGGSVLDGIESADGWTLILTVGARGVPTDAVIVKKNSER